MRILHFLFYSLTFLVGCHPVPVPAKDCPPGTYDYVFHIDMAPDLDVCISNWMTPDQFWQNVVTGHGGQVVTPIAINTNLPWLEIFGVDSTSKANRALLGLHGLLPGSNYVVLCKLDIGDSWFTNGLLVANSTDVTNWFNGLNIWQSRLDQRLMYSAPSVYFTFRGAWLTQKKNEVFVNGVEPYLLFIMGFICVKIIYYQLL